MHQLIERRQQTRLLLDRRLVATTNRALTMRRLDPRLDFRRRLGHRVTRHPRRVRDTRLTTTPQRHRHRTRHHTRLHLIQMRQHDVEELTQLLDRRIDETGVASSLEGPLTVSTTLV